MRIEAPNLQEAFQRAANELGCSVTELDIKVIQHPNSGFLGFFKKSAIIEVEREKSLKDEERSKFKNKERHEKNEKHKKHTAAENSDHVKSKPQNSENSENLTQDKSQEKGEKHGKNGKHDHDEKKRNKHKKHRDNHEKHQDDKASKQSVSEKGWSLAETAFGEKQSQSEPVQTEFELPKADYIIKRTDIPEQDEPKAVKEPAKNILDSSILDNFNQISDEHDEGQEPQSAEKPAKSKRELIDIEKILPEIQAGLERLFKASCFAIDKINVSKFNDECVLIELDGEDAALLIGKEGYRYKAISYLLHNWLGGKYNLAIRLEIAQFLKNQEAAIEQYLASVIERVQNTGRAQTKPLDGVLVKIALEKLRERFPDKYVGIKSNNEGKFVIVNEFFKK